MKKTVLITGASRGIGRSMALLYAKHNYNVVICSRQIDTLQNTAREINELGAECLAVAADAAA